VLGEIQTTPYDLRFSLFGIPVRVHPLFWLVTVVLGFSRDPRVLLTWVAVVFVSILIHELGHAAMSRRFGWRSHIVLYAMGGLAYHDPHRHDPRKEMMISLAGPAAGFALAGVVLLILQSTGHPVKLVFGLPMIVTWGPVDLPNPSVNTAVQMLLFVNIWWGLVNLLPVLPLDGGRFTSELLMDLRVSYAMAKTLTLSIAVAIGVAIYAYSQLQLTYVALMFGCLAYNDYMAFQQLSGRGGGYDGW
jgi:Zn-dependent protease